VFFKVTFLVNICIQFQKLLVRLDNIYLKRYNKRSTLRKTILITKLAPTCYRVKVMVWLCKIMVPEHKVLNLER